MTRQEIEQVIRHLAGDGFTVRAVRRLPSGSVELVILLPS